MVLFYRVYKEGNSSVAYNSDFLLLQIDSENGEEHDRGRVHLGGAQFSSVLENWVVLLAL